MAAIKEVFERAVRHHQNGDFQMADLLYRQVIQAEPGHVAAHSNLGVLLSAKDRGPEALAHFAKAVELNPNHAGAQNNLGNALKSQEQFQAAVDCYRRAIYLNPNFGDAHFNLGNMLYGLGQFQEALKSYRQALRVNADNADAYLKLGYILFEQDQLDEAAECFRQVLRIVPNHADAHNNLGSVNLRQGQIADSEKSYRKAISIDPNNAVPYKNLGNVLWIKQQLMEAEECFRKALLHKPDYDDAHVNLGMLCLLKSHFEEGWSELEHRIRLKKLAFHPYPQPRWNGAPLDGKIILLVTEQGLGDTLQFIRYAPIVKQRGGTVILGCAAELVRILESCAGIDQILTPGSPLPVFDVQIPLLSLPGILKTTLATIPASIPYLRADPALTQYWQHELSIYPEFKIGIVWQGNPRFSQPDCRAADKRRSISLSHIEPLAHLPGVRLFSLQKGHGSEQLADWKSQWDIIDLGEKLGDFMDTAAVMMNLDLIISADTSPVHLAGALGRPVWTVLPFAGCWRWLLDREDSPWYPTMRLFRQKKAGDWGEVFQRMAGELARRLKA